MSAIRYGIHFASLALAAAIFWLVRDLRLPVWVSNFNFPHYALMGALHATSIVVSLRDRRTVVRTLSFITLATILSAATPLLGLWGSIGLIPSAGILRENALVVTFVTGSTVGASGYWL